MRPFAIGALCALALCAGLPAASAKLERQRRFDEWFMRGRQSHDAKSPAQHRQEALRGAKPGAHSARAVPAVVGGAWSPLGPAPLTQLGGTAASGRISALALDLATDPTGNLLYAGGANGGVWKCANAQGASPTWTPLGDGLQSLAVGCLALDNSTSPATLYVGTGEANLSADSYYGLGILKSSDGGSTWSLAASADGGTHPFQGLFFSDIKVDPSNPAILVAAAGRSDMAYWSATPPERGIFRSTDAGASWSLVYNPGHGVTSLAYDPAHSAYYAAVSTLGLMKSTNQGLSWTAMASPFPSGTTTTAVSAGGLYFDRAVLAVRGGTLYCLVGGPTDLYAPSPPTDSALSQSSDGGVTWAKVGLGGIASSDAGQADYDIFLGAPTGSAGLVIGLLDVFTTAAIGTSSTWANTTHVYSGGTVHTDQHAFAAKDATHWFTGNDGGVWRTSDGGATWANLNSNLSLTQFTSVSPDPFNAGTYLGGAQDNGSEKTSASSLQWAQILGGDGGYTAISPLTPDRWFSEYNGVNLQRSDSASTSFVPVVDSTTVADKAEFYVPYALVPGSPGTVVLGAERMWRGPAVPSGPGAGWAAISQHLGDPVVALDIAVSNPNICYATTSGSSQLTPTPKIYKSSNLLAPPASVVWTDVSGANLPATRLLSCVAVDPMDAAKACVGVQSFGSGHVFLTVDGGGHWTDISGNLPDLPVNALAYDPLWPSYLYAATDAGVYGITDGGAAGASEVWQQMGSGLPNTTVFQVKLSAQVPRKLVAATHGRGAWTLPALVPPTPTITPTSTISPTFTVSPTSTPTPTVSPTFTQSATPGYAQAPSAKNAVLYPSPLRKGEPLCLALGTPFLGDVQLQVYNMVGERVLAFDYGPRNACVPTDKLAAGIYFGVLELPSGRSILKFALLGN